jgi:hypothetical protein
MRLMSSTASGSEVQIVAVRCDQYQTAVCVYSQRLETHALTQRTVLITEGTKEVSCSTCVGAVPDDPLL